MTVELFFIWLEQIVVLTVALIGLGVALVLVRRSRSATAGQSLSGRLSSVIAVLGVIALWLIRFWFPDLTDAPWRFALPLAAAAIAIAIFAVTGANAHPGGGVREVDLSPRSVWTFGSSWWFVGLFMLAGVLVATVVFAGLASSPDDDGQFTRIVLDMGNAQASTVFFGWAFGIPVLVGLVLLLLIVFVALWRIARAAVPADPIRREHETAARRNQARTVLSISSGATAFTLGAALGFLGRSSSLAASITVPQGGQVQLVTSFAALGTPFVIAGLLLQGFGISMLILPLCQPLAQRASATLDRSEVAATPVGR
jgi:cytochrome bd-type quinol oxidase subunit 2